MFQRALPLCLTLAIASLAQANARITLVANPMNSDGHPAGEYVVGAVVTVNVMLSQDGENTPADRLLRMAQMDFSDSTLAVSAAPVWTLGGLTGCVGHPGTPCMGYYFDNDLGPASFGDKTASMAYYFQSDTNLGPNPTAQLTVPMAGQVQIGTLGPFTLNTAGDFVLDVLNSNNTDANLGSVVYWGHGLTVDDPVRIFRPDNNAPNDLLGDTLALHVVPGDETVTLVSSSPASCTTANGNLSSLWRNANNFILLNFDGVIAAPGAGQLEIRQIMAGGSFGPNLNTGGAFAFSLENGNTRLRVRENGSVFAHRQWYQISNGTWPGVDPFAVKLVVQRGDANNDGRVLAVDVSLVNTGIPCANTTTCADDRRDINGDNRILAIDASAANASIVSTNVNIPTGHTCP